MKRPFFSIVIATYNSEKTLGYTLQSIKNQEFDKEDIEILVIDGGSTDRTKDIAKEFNAIVLENRMKLPEYAKAIGVANATGKYIIRMDSDEEFVYSSQLQEKKDFYLNHKDIYVLLGNRYVDGRKEICGISAPYMNILGDPFSYFVYKLDDDRCITYKNNIIWNEKKEHIFRFGDNDILPLADSGTCSYSLDFIKNTFPELRS